MTDPDSKKTPEARPNGRRLVIGIIVYAAIFGLALSLSIRHVVHDIRDSAAARREAEAKSRSRAAEEAKTGAPSSTGAAKTQ